MTRRQVLKLGAVGGAAAAGIGAGFVVRAAAQGRELVVAFSIDPGHMDPRG
ncbi:MAG: twin-arginine translocation signal domain-containing protein [Candidatus Rokuibacteriota bacterium]